MKLLVSSTEVVRSALARVAPDMQLVAARPDELARATPGKIAIIDEATLAALTSAPPVPVVLVVEGELPAAVTRLVEHPWLAHVVHLTTFDQPLAADHVRRLLRSLAAEDAPRLLEWIPSSFTARRVLLAQASHRDERIERMTAFFEGNGVSARTTRIIADATEELVTNAFYDGPIAAGIVAEPIPRTMDVRLPDDQACDLVYGCGDDLAIVRITDPFGAIARRRIVETLARCSALGMQVELDGATGGAGLGWWRIVSGASFVAVSVEPHRSTEIVVGVWKRPPNKARPFGFHWFEARTARPRAWVGGSEGLSVTLTAVPEPVG